MDELELPRIRAEKKLIEHNGDIIAATKDLLGF
nr:Bm141 [Brugia malayi]